MPQLFFPGLEFADNIHYNFKSIAKLRKPGCQASELQTHRHKTEFKAKWPFKVIQGHVFWSQWKGEGLSNKILMLALFIKIPTM